MQWLEYGQSLELLYTENFLYSMYLLPVVTALPQGNLKCLLPRYCELSSHMILIYVPCALKTNIMSLACNV